MPTISIFIRKEDLPKWKELTNKSEWLHNKLGDFYVPQITRSPRLTPPGTSDEPTAREQSIKPKTPKTTPVSYKNTTSWGA